MVTQQRRTPPIPPAKPPVRTLANVQDKEIHAWRYWWSTGEYIKRKDIRRITRMLLTDAELYKDYAVEVGLTRLQEFKLLHAAVWLLNAAAAYLIIRRKSKWQRR